MKKVLTVFVLFGLMSCSFLRTSRHYDGIDPQFQPYVNYFKIMSNGKVTDSDLKNVSMGFRDYKDGSNTVGTCHPMLFLTEIDINKKWWDNNYSHLERMELIFHELGHCVLNRNHTEPTSSKGFFGWLERTAFKLGLMKRKDLLYDGCPSSIMHPNVLSEYCISKHYNYYMEELYTEISYDDWSAKHLRYIMQPSCNKPKVINHTETWTRGDEETLERAGKTCLKRYKSCLKTFIKKEELTYNAICS